MPVIVNLGEERRRRKSLQRYAIAEDDEGSYLAHPAIAGTIIGLALVVMLIVGIITFRNSSGRTGVHREQAQAAAKQSQEDERERLRPPYVGSPIPGVSRDMR